MSTDDKQPVYKAARGSDQKAYVDGPGNGTSYYSGMLYPDMRLSSEEDAKAAAKIANVAYKEGYEKAQRDICQALGINSLLKNLR
jgi:hypothetical protein